MAESVIVELDVRVDSVEKEIAKLKKALEDTKKKTNELSDAQKENIKNLDRFTGGAISGFRALKSGIQSAVIGMKTLRGAIAATGIGLLIVAFTSLMAYFKKTERGAQQLRVITAALGAAFDVIVDVVIGLGESIFNLFTNPKEAIMDFYQTLKTFVIDAFNNILDGAMLLGGALVKLFSGDFTGAMEDAKDGVVKLAKGFGAGIVAAVEITGTLVEKVIEVGEKALEAADAAGKLADRMNKVLVSERKLKVERAEANAELAKQKMIADDITKSAEERIEAAKKASKLEGDLLARELANEQERLNIMKAQAALAESDEETLNAIADQEVKLATLRQQSGMRQIELNNKLNSIRKEDEAKKAAEAQKAKEEEEARLKRIQTIADAELAAERAIRDAKIALIDDVDEREKQLQKAKEDYYLEDKARLEAQLADLDENTDAYAEIQSKLIKLNADRNVQIEQDNKKNNDKEIADAKAVAAAKEAIAKSGVELLKQLAGEGSDLAKSLAVAQVAYDTYGAVMAAYRTGMATGGLPLAIAQSVIAAGFGALQVKKILADDGTGGGSAGGSAASAMVTPSVNLTSAANQNNALGNIAQNTSSPMRAYVVSKDVASAAAYERSRKTIGTL